MSHTGTVRLHETSMGVIGEVDQLGRSNWNISVNGSRLELLKMGGICDKCRKKVVKGAGIFCGFFV